MVIENFYKEAEFSKSGTSIVKISKPKPLKRCLCFAIGRFPCGGGRKQEASAAYFPLKPQKKMKKNWCIFVQKRRINGFLGKRRCFLRRWFPPGRGRSLSAAGILELRLPGSASSRTSDCECSQMDESSNHLHSLFSYGEAGVGPHRAFSKHVRQALLTREVSPRG